MHSSILFASHAAHQSFSAFARKGDYQAAKQEHMACMNDLKVELKACSVSQFNIAAESTMKIGYLLYYLPKRLRLRRLRLSSSLSAGFTWQHWVQMAWFIDYGINDIPLDPRRYLGYQRNRIKTLSHVTAFGPLEFWSNGQLENYQRETIADNENIISRWCRLTELIADQRLLTRSNR